MTTKWVKDSQLLRDDDTNVKMSFENNVVRNFFSSVQTEHRGKYTCLAQNEAGQQKCDTVLSIQGLRHTVCSDFPSTKVSLLIVCAVVS